MSRRSASIEYKRCKAGEEREEEDDDEDGVFGSPLLSAAEEEEGEDEAGGRAGEVDVAVLTESAGLEESELERVGGLTVSTPCSMCDHKESAMRDMDANEGDVSN